MKLYIDMEGNKGVIGTAHQFSYEDVMVEASNLLDENSLDEEHLNTVAAGILTRDITDLLRGLLEAYEAGPPSEGNSKEVLTRSGVPIGVLVGLDGKPIQKK